MMKPLANYQMRWNRQLLFSLLLFVGLGLPNYTFAQSGHQFSVELSEFDAAQIFLYHYYGATPSKIDSAMLNEEGVFVFEGEEALPKGMYIFLLPPHNKAIQFFVNESDQHFSVEADYQQLNANFIRFEGSAENELFYQYLRTISEHNVYAQAFNQNVQTAESAEVKKIYRQKLDSLHKEVKGYQAQFISEHPQSMTAILAGLDKETPTPKFEGTDDEILKKRYLFIRAHYFDHIDLADSNLIHFPLFVRKFDNYINRLIPQDADSLNIAIDQLLQQIPEDGANYRYFVRYLLRTYENPRYVGLDKVYVDLAEKYVAEGKALWLEESERKKVLKRAEQFKAILIGASAPEITLFKKDGSEISLYDIEAEYTILFFWRPGCGHCKKARPFMKAFYEEYKNKGIEIFSLCTNLRNTTPECWTYIDEHQLHDWINAADTNNRSRFIQKYNAGRTPRIFVLDKNKKILIKNFEAERLKEVMDGILEKAEKGAGQ